MEMNMVKEAFERVRKKQRVCNSTCQDVIEKLRDEIEQVLAEIVPPPHLSSPVIVVDLKSVLRALREKVDGIGARNQVEACHKELGADLGKFGKLVDRCFTPDISRAYRRVEFDVGIINHVIANHLYQRGLFDIGDSLISEGGGILPVSVPPTLKLQFMEMHEILEAVKSRRLDLAFKWVSTNREWLRNNGSDLELKLHRLQFVEILQKGERGEALVYARRNLAEFAAVHMEELQRLMGCLLWAGKLERSPYRELTGSGHWEKVGEEVAVQFCNLVGQSERSPLEVVVGAGVEGLPTLLKLASLMGGKKQEWEGMKQLPVPVELGREFQFHSVFVCPVSREQGSEDNPPMLMACGHALCKHSIMKLSKNGTRPFKCPYCPLDATLSQCKQLYF